MARGRVVRGSQVRGKRGVFAIDVDGARGEVSRFPCTGRIGIGEIFPDAIGVAIARYGPETCVTCRGGCTLVSCDNGVLRVPGGGSGCRIVAIGKIGVGTPSVNKCVRGSTSRHVGCYLNTLRVVRGGGVVSGMYRLSLAGLANVGVGCSGHVCTGYKNCRDCRDFRCHLGILGRLVGRRVSTCRGIRISLAVRRAIIHPCRSRGAGGRQVRGRGRRTLTGGGTRRRTGRGGGTRSGRGS